MKAILRFTGVLLMMAAPLRAEDAITPVAIIDRARATVGTEDRLEGLVTLELVGELAPADPSVPEATLLILARKPCS
ncbi:MAG: hypothetical protein ACLFU4_09710, partial [Opitutales bacterium]